MGKNRIDITRKDECCGCSACYSICPTKAIEMTPDEEGFLYPAINSAKCVDCGLCSDVCPLKQEQKDIAEQEYFAVKHVDEEIRERSTSGGVFSMLAEYITKMDGVVYGVAFDDELKVSHQRATGDNWHIFRGAKYVQSDMNHTFESVKEDLKKEKWVLFSGTPCQVDGLKNYLEKSRVDTAKLVTCDLVCHGVPSPKMWKDYVNTISDSANIGRVSFREKQGTGWHSSRFRVEGHNEEVLADIEQGKGVFLAGFSNNTSLRPSCYSCKYTNYDRVGDFTMGDFWGIEKSNPDFDDNKGVSLVMVNSLKAKHIWDEIKDAAVVLEVAKEQCFQPNLGSPSECYGDRGLFWKTYRWYGIEAAGKMLGYIEISKPTRMMYTLLRKWIRVREKLEK